MKKYTINPVTGEATEMVEDGQVTWQIVEVHYSVDTHRFRAVAYNDKKIIIEEKLCDTRVDAEMYIAHQLMDNSQQELEF